MSPAPRTPHSHLLAPYGDACHISVHGMVPKGEEASRTPSRAPGDSGGRLGEVRSLWAYGHPGEARPELARVPVLRLSSPDARARIRRAAAGRGFHRRDRGGSAVQGPARLSGVSRAAEEG